MIYFLEERNGEEKHAGAKARTDILNILRDMGGKGLDIDSVEKRSGWNKYIFNKRRIEEKIQKIVKQDSDVNLVIQFPLRREHETIFLGQIIRKFQKKGVKIILLIHDLESLRISVEKGNSLKTRILCYIKEKFVLRNCNNIIVHNEQMKQTLIERKILEKNLFVLHLFDYLHDANQDKKRRFRPKNSEDYSICIAGNLNQNKAGYIYSLPSFPQYLLYGIEYDVTFQQNNIEYKGSFSPEELEKELSGEFGLVWDGFSADTCMGVYGEYLRINNPHKTSLYLSCGIPVIIWKEAALASFILKNNVGIVVSSLYDIEEKLKKLSLEEYLVMKGKAEQMSVKLKQGYFTKNVMNEIMNQKEA